MHSYDLSVERPLVTPRDGLCGCPQDLEKAAYYYHMAAEGGVPAGLSWTGHLLMTGFGAGGLLLLHRWSPGQLNNLSPGWKFSYYVPKTAQAVDPPPNYQSLQRLLKLGNNINQNECCRTLVMGSTWHEGCRRREEDDARERAPLLMQSCH